MARKIDLSGVKNFFLAKGDKLGVAVCLAAACVLVGYGVMNGMGAKNAPNSTDTYAEAYDKNLRKLRDQMNRGVEVTELVLPTVPAWDRRQPNAIPIGRLFETNDVANNKRLNPRALAVKADPEKNQIRMDYIRGPIFAWDINHQRKTATVIKAAAPAAGGQAGPNFGVGGALPGAGKMQPMGLQPVVTVQPKRMVVVQAVFPLNEQIEEFRKAFRMMHAAELFKSKDLPHFLGLNVMKTETTPGQPPVTTTLVAYNPVTEKNEIDPALLAMMREMIFDDQLVTLGAPFAFQGLVMPLPKLAELPLGKTYPKANLEGLDEIWDFVANGGVLAGAGGAGLQNAPGLGGKLPGMPGPGNNRAGADAELDSTVPWAKLTPDLKDKFHDDFYYFDPLGIFPNPNEGLPLVIGEKGEPVMQAPRDPEAAAEVGSFHVPSAFAAPAQWSKFPAPKMPKNLMPAGKDGLPAAAAAPVNPNVKPYEALVRFVDVDVKPGRTYKYTIQVRVANPNFKKPTEVAFAALADLKELPPASPVETPSITIPTEYFLYAIDQKPFNPKVANGSDDRDVKPDMKSATPTQTQVPIQIHTWVDRTVDEVTGAFVVADWAIAERLLLRRGDIVGKRTNVEIPIWDKKQGTYRLSPPSSAEGNEVKAKQLGKGGMMMPPAGLGMKPAPRREIAMEAGSVGIPVDFAESNPPAVLIDFDGGRKGYQIPTGSGMSKVTDESAINILILNADGKLIVRNSRVDSDPDAPEYKVRQDRIEEWKKKVSTIRPAAGGALPGGGVPDAPNPFLMPRKGGT